MDHAKRVQYCRSELEKARRNFPPMSNEVQVAENVYQAALSAAVCDGSPAVRGSDLSLSDDDSLRAAFYCDNVNVMTAFYCRDERIARPIIFAIADAGQVGERIREMGVCEDCPFEVSISAIKTFGDRLKGYGERASG